MAFCRKCGTELPPDAQFCSKCGTSTVLGAPTVPPPSSSSTPGVPRPAARPVQSAQPVPGRSSRWWIGPAIVVGLVVLAWLFIAGMPFGRDEPTPRAVAPQTDTIAEAEPPPTTGTLIEVPPGATDDSFEIATTTTQAPPVVTATTPPPVTATQPPPVVTATQPPPVQRPPVQRPPVVAQQPRPVPQQPQTQQPRPDTAPPVRVIPRPTRAAEITGEEATETLRSYVRGSRYYQVAGECIRVENRGYRNVGYNMEVWHSCPGGGTSRLLGRWRVDSKTREVFVQRDDGRYLRP
jgi:zinc-ribbon domain